MDEKLIETVDSLADKYAKERSINGATNGNAVYALVDADGRTKIELGIKRVPYHTCFGVLNQISNYLSGVNSPEALLIQMQKHLYGEQKEFDKEFHLYYEWLFNFSPFRDAFITKDAAKVIDRGVIVVDTDIDSRIMIGGAISTRHPWESFSNYASQMRPIMRLWKRMVEGGMHPNYAFVLAFGLRTSDHGASWMTAASGFGHHALSYGSYADSATNLHSNFANDRKRQDKVASYRTAKQYVSPSQLFGLQVKGEHANFHQWTKKHIEIAATGKAKKVNPFATETATTVAVDKLIPHFMELQSEFLQAA